MEHLKIFPSLKTTYKILCLYSMKSLIHANRFQGIQNHASHSNENLYHSAFSLPSPNLLPKVGLEWSLTSVLILKCLDKVLPSVNLPFPILDFRVIMWVKLELAFVHLPVVSLCNNVSIV